MSRRTITLACALLSARCVTTSPDISLPGEGGSDALASLPCQGSLERGYRPQGPLLWGAKRQYDDQERSNMMSSLELGGVQWNEGRLMAPIGTRFRGTAGDGTPVEVALCGAEPQNDGSGLIWYQLELRSAQSTAWVNPCFESTALPSPRALALKGVWNERGAHEARPGRFTFACESGVIAKCVDWGYKPWATKNGQSLANIHQACTRMARADYCGDGRSHTSEGTIIDLYDVLGIQNPAQPPSEGSSLDGLTFGAAWTPEGAVCLSHTRNGTAISDILDECPGRFVMNPNDLGEGDPCVATRRNVDPNTAVLRDRSRPRVPTLGMSSTFP